METIILFLKDCLSERSQYQNLDKNASIFVVSCIRLLNCWLMHENLLEKELIDLMPNVIEFSKYFQEESKHNQEFELNVFEFIVPSLKRVLSDEKQYLKDKFSARLGAGEDETKREFEKSEQEEYVNSIEKMLAKCDIRSLKND